MKTRVAINGFGRIGRNAFKVAFERSDIEIVAINDAADPANLAYLLRHDSAYGTYQHQVSHDAGTIIVNGSAIKVINEQDPSQYPWRDFDVDIVIEATAEYADPTLARVHIDTGAKRVVLAAPADGVTTVVLGVNEDSLDPKTEIISSSSCSTNCAAPVISVLESAFGVEKAMLNTVHSYTTSQRLVDGPAEGVRQSRAAAQNIVPLASGASSAVPAVIPGLTGNFSALAVRVPTQVVSLADMVLVLKRNVTADDINETLSKAAGEPYYQGILSVTDEELVSSDFIGNSHSAIVDLKLTTVVGGNLARVVAWYDNEWGYSNRLVEVVADVGRALRQASEQ